MRLQSASESLLYVDDDDAFESQKEVGAGASKSSSASSESNTGNSRTHQVYWITPYSVQNARR